MSRTFMSSVSGSDSLFSLGTFSPNSRLISKHNCWLTLFTLPLHLRSPPPTQECVVTSKHVQILLKTVCELIWRKRRDIDLLSLFIIMLAFVVKNDCFAMCCSWLPYRGTPFEPFPDSLSPEEILEQAQGAAKEARQELSMRKPKTDVSSHGVLLHGATGAICWRE